MKKSGLLLFVVVLVVILATQCWPKPKPPIETSTVIPTWTLTLTPKPTSTSTPTIEPTLTPTVEPTETLLPTVIVPTATSTLVPTVPVVTPNRWCWNPYGYWTYNCLFWVDPNLYRGMP